MRRRQPPVALIRNNILIRADIANQVDYMDVYDRLFFEEKICTPCGLRDYRPANECYSCPGLKERIKLYEHKVVKNTAYVGVPWGDQKVVENLFDISYDEEDVLDQRACPPMPHRLKWVKPLYTGKEVINGKKTPNQVKIANKWLEKKSGIIQAPPRTGKATLAAYIGTKIGYRVLILAHESHLCHQMAKEYVTMTNVEQVAERKGLNIKELILHIDKNKNIDRKTIEKACVVSVNYQKFIYSEARLKILKDMFGIVFVDECHQASAGTFSRILNSTNSRYRCGLSATPKRRDRKDIVSRIIIGPVTVKSSTTAMLPKITPVETGFSLPPSAGDPRDGGVSHIYRSKSRNKLIVKKVMQDIKDGHPGVIVPIAFKYHIDELYRMFLKEFDGDKSKVIVYKGGVVKSSKLTEFEETGKIFLGQWQMVKQGITFKKATSIHLVVPRADKYMFYQLVNRVCTPQENKRQPVVRWYVDRVPISYGGFRLIFFDEIIKMKKGNRHGNPATYILTPEDERDFFDIVHKGSAPVHKIPKNSKIKGIRRL